MHRKILIRLMVLIVFTLLISAECKPQSRWKPYFNMGYITNLKKSSDTDKPDVGGSVRIGILNKGAFGKGRIGFYAGYLWFNEYHKDYIGYDDKGSVLMAGIDILLFNQEDMQWYLKTGIGQEKYTSVYPNYIESESSIKPDIGLLIIFKHLNSYLGWQPSDPDHINIGLGLTF